MSEDGDDLLLILGCSFAGLTVDTIDRWLLDRLAPETWLKIEIHEVAEEEPADQE